MLGKSIITVAKVSPSVISGVSQFIKELGSDSYYVVRGNKKKQKLKIRTKPEIEKMLQNNDKIDIMKKYPA